jgi:hypothetical protein
MSERKISPIGGDGAILNLSAAAGPESAPDDDRRAWCWIDAAQSRRLPDWQYFTPWFWVGYGLQE